ncbi:DNA-processing protein DprA [Fulvivirga maritima]|uniref:DNA-processing protein DprA n=1 Tax=Fulvivirga maritima TaxID=2904247 RepID=UPI001F2B8EE7|nr:DNA-processing protein DprA [Fulvivirga maritima]UII29105.1 DNA-processing protein DprA [Fulvivirga maritima]
MNTKYLLTLLNVPSFGRKSIKTVFERFSGSLSDLEDLNELLKNGSKLNTQIKVPAKDVLQRAYDTALTIMDKSDQNGIQIISCYDDLFPNELHQIPDSPIVLHVKGNLSAIEQNERVAIIGTREPTEWGERAGKRIAQIFTERGYAVVSGLAKGCDTSAHIGCLERNGTTVAVMASGLDHIYPSDNKELASNILQNNGCLVSEYQIGLRPQRNYFTERDRIQSGLSKGVIVVETGYKGGTMHTVKFAIEQSKRLACIVGHPEKYSKSDKIKGGYSLVNRQVAFGIGNPNDIDFFMTLLSSK